MKFKLFISTLLISLLLVAQAAERTITASLPCTNLVAATATNTTAGAALTIEPSRAGYVWIYGEGLPASTNGQLTAVVECSPDGTVWESQITGGTLVSVTNQVGTVTNSARALVDLTGARQVRVKQIRNTLMGQMTNISLKLSYDTIK